MTAIGKIIQGRSRRVRCDGCGRISSDREQGYYVDGPTGKGGTITSKGRECEHDFCDQCEEKNPDPDVCPKCGVRCTARDEVQQ